TLPQIEEEYVNTGKVKFVYKHFPLDNIHPQATPAALASECAQEQGKFWEFHNTIFENQQSLSDASYKQWAVDLSLDTEKFNDCYDTQKYLSDVRDDLQKGSAAGIRGTPGFLLNGQLISGAKPFAVFEQAIEAELAG
ncbi:disulfide bond formation protein DsbA, partial [Candidatus Woesearchaeota archaeon]|nr:disulfide bond formation protein DsbA [Candidatus Woesearchaeota archaeon]